MTGQDLINAVISYYDNTLATDAGNTNRRLRILNNAQHIVDEVINQRPWPFKFKKANITITAGVGPLPADFGRLGPEGFVGEPSTHKVYTEILMQDFEDLITQANHQFRMFAIGSEDGGTTRNIYIPDTGSNTTLQMVYEPLPPTLADDNTQIPMIPPSYHRTVLLAGTIMRTQTDKNDVRIYWEREYMKGLGRMIVNEMPLQSRVKQLPLSTGKRMW